MNEKGLMTNERFGIMFEKAMNSKNAPFYATMLAIVGVYAVHEYFEMVDKAMDKGYDATVQMGENEFVSFTKGKSEKTKGINELDENAMVSDVDITDVNSHFKEIE